MARGYRVKGNVIIINRDLTELDRFLKSFLSVLKKHSDYLVVSGFVSISTGRIRGTEDIDVIVPVMGKSKFKSLFDELVAEDFWCYQGDYSDAVYSYIKNLDSIRFAKKNTLFPNIEFIPFDKTKKAKTFEFNHPQKVRVCDFEFKIPPLEFEILYKELLLSGKKDMEDARHLRVFFEDILDNERFKNYEKIIRSELK